MARLIWLSVVLALVGCAAPHTLPLPSAVLWHDDAFNYRPELVEESRESLFSLDDSMLASLKIPSAMMASTERRLELLLDQLYGSGVVKLSYASGHSTGAAKTWQNRRGDCLSLTIMTYASAKAMGIPARMQEVPIPVAIERRTGVDYLNGHVNVYVPVAARLQIDGRSLDGGGVIVDFEPQAGSRQKGMTLTEEEILGRFYNNRATEYLTQGKADLSYAYYKAALGADPSFWASYGNLAQLYMRRGLTGSAETLLRHAMALNPDSHVPLLTLQRLLLGQGREAEALEIAELLKKHQEADPYHWLSVGVNHLKNQRYDQAIAALQRAQEIASGFDEVHRNLAIAFWRNGQIPAAEEQLALLAGLAKGDSQVALLRAKLSGSSHATLSR